jgi:hypothetical protein
MRLESAFVAVALVAWTLAACSDDEGKDDDSSASTYGVCTLEDGSRRSCLESTGSPSNIENQREGCLDEGGTWSDEPCPEPADGACCTYTFGLEFRECVYTSAAAGSDLIAQCTTNFEDCMCTPGPG